MLRDAAAFGELVRRYRRAKKLTQRDLALIAGVGERFVVDLDTGKATCQLGKSLAVAAAVGIDLVDRRPPTGRTPDEPEFPDLGAARVAGERP